MYCRRHSTVAYLLKRLQSVMNSTARLVFSSSLYDHVSPLLRQLHWLKARERIEFKLAAILVYKCQHGAAPSYLADELNQPANLEGRRRLRSASLPSLIVRRMRLSTIGDRAFPVAAARVWNGLHDAACHVRIITICLQQPSEDTSL